jgi:hypothetical protein
MVFLFAIGGVLSPSLKPSDRLADDFGRAPIAGGAPVGGAFEGGGAPEGGAFFSGGGGGPFGMTALGRPICPRVTGTVDTRFGGGPAGGVGRLGGALLGRPVAGGFPRAANETSKRRAVGVAPVGGGPFGRGLASDTNFGAVGKISLVRRGPDPLGSALGIGGAPLVIAALVLRNTLVGGSPWGLKDGAVPVVLKARLSKA